MKKFTLILLTTFTVILPLQASWFTNPRFLGAVGALAIVGWKKYRTPVQAETFFYKDNGTPLMPQEHQAAFQATLRHQFPMCSTSNTPYNPNEVQAIQESLLKQHPHIKVNFIPTVIYELFFMQYITKSIKEERLKEDKGQMSEGSKALTNLKNEDYRSLHYAINGIIAQYCKSNNITSYKQILQDKDLMKKAEECYQECLGYGKSGEFFLDISLLEKVSDLEEESYKEGKALLYRGACLEKDIFNKKFYGNYYQRGLSFGASLFGGLMFDTGIKGACAYTYMRQAENDGYAIPIVKKDYLNALKKKANVFHIPSLTTLANIYGQGEVFHPRSKVISTPSINDSGLAFPGHVKKSEKPEFFFSGKEEDQIRDFKSIFKYVKHNYIKLKEGSTTFDKRKYKNYKGGFIILE